MLLIVIHYTHYRSPVFCIVFLLMSCSSLTFLSKKTIILTGSAVFVNVVAGCVNVGSSVSLRLDPQVSVSAHADVVAMEVSRLESIAARVERVTMHDVRSTLSEKQQMLRRDVGFQENMEVVVVMPNVPVGKGGMPQRDAAWTQCLRDCVPRTAAAQQERRGVHCRQRLKDVVFR